MTTLSTHTGSTPRFLLVAIGLLVVVASLAGCHGNSGRPSPGPEVVRPEEIMDFQTLYRTNCSACHGANGTGGPAISLANPIYLAITGKDVIRSTASKGIPGKLMPAFAKSSGGTLTDKQIDALVNGMMQKWGAPVDLASQNPPPYKANLSGHIDQGHKEFQNSCSSCHGANGEGSSKPLKGNSLVIKTGSIVDPTYLDLVSNQSIRSVLIAGRHDLGMPDWRSDSGTPLTDQQITDIVAWIVSNRIDSPGQPYATTQ
jgi:mono/diheme cytochrome c family protein